MKHILNAIICIYLATSLLAQEKQFTMEDVVINSYNSLTSEKLNQLAWVPSTELISFEEEKNIYQFNVKTLKKSSIIDLKEINDLIRNAGFMKQFIKVPKYKFIDRSKLSLWVDTSRIIIDLESRNLVNSNKVLKNAKNKSISPNKKFVAFTLDNNLYVSLSGDEIRRITNEANQDVVSGQSVSRNEFGIKKGIFWSTKNNYLAYYQKDESDVTNYPIIDIESTPATVKYTKYPMAGQNSETVTIGIYDINNDKTVWLKTEGPRDQYLTNVTWDPSEKYIYVAHLNRDQNHLKLYKYDSMTGERVKLLFEERDDEYVEPKHSLKFILKDKSQFVWFSENSGWQHLYIYDIDGKLIKQVTDGNWAVNKIIGINNNKDVIYFSANKDTPLENHIYKVYLPTGEIERITKLGFTHKLIYNEANNKFIDTYSSLETPNIYQIIDDHGSIIAKIKKSKNALEKYSVSQPKILKLKGKNGFDLYSRIILPTNFDPSKKYPAVVYVYGGPHAQLVKNEWFYGRYHFWFQYMAQRGFVVFTLDNRGSANRGLEFEQEVFRRLGTKEIEDQMIGVEYLKSLDYVDKNRLGVYGWSYGGFMTASLMLRTNDTFKVGVAGGTVTDWKFYEAMYGERYMDTPESNPKGYAESSLLNYVENLNGKLLLVHGTVDPTVVLQHVLEFAKKAVSLNKPLDFYPYVGHGHGVKGKDTIHLYEKISNYFIENL